MCSVARAHGFWLRSQPLPGHAICNIGDTLNIFSGGVLRSNIHRVVCVSSITPFSLLSPFAHPQTSEQTPTRESRAVRALVGRVLHAPRRRSHPPAPVREERHDCSGRRTRPAWQVRAGGDGPRVAQTKIPQCAGYALKGSFDVVTTVLEDALELTWAHDDLGPRELERQTGD